MATHPRQRVRALVVTTPANTAEAAAQTTSWTVGHGVLRRLEVVIPDGHVGLTGLALRWGGRQLVPYEAGEWLTGNDDEIHVDLDLYTGLGVVQVVTFNTDDAFEHSHHLRAFVEDLDGAVGFDVPLERIGGLEGGGLPELGGDLTAEENAIVSAAGDQFLADLQAILQGFLVELQATLGVTPGAPGVPILPPEELPPEEIPAVIVPNLIGATRTAAEDALYLLGLQPMVIETAHTGTVGLVLTQDPPPGTEVEPGSAVSLSVSIATAAAPPEPAKLTVPDVVGKLRPRAKDLLRGAGFTVATEFKVETGRADEVIRQQPVGGAQRVAGFTVTITVRRNP